MKLESLVMKRKHSGYIVASFLFSLCSLLVHVICVLSEHWVEAEAVPFGGGNVTYINYGLFSGTFVQNLNDLSSITTPLSLVCILKLNICAWTCQTSEDLRIKDIYTLYDTGQILYGCSEESDGTHRKSPTGSPFKPQEEVKASFINGAVWLSTVLLVSVSQFLNIISLVLTAYNVTHIPFNSWVALRNLYFWFGATGIVAVLTLFVWGLEYLLKIKENIGIVDTIAGVLDNGKSRLGYSFWCLIGVVVLQSCCAALLYYREQLFDQPLFRIPLQIQPNSISSLRFY